MLLSLRSCQLRYLLAAGAPILAGMAGQALAEPADATWPDGTRRWTVSDSVGLSYLSRQGVNPLGADAIALRDGDPVLWSPDRRHLLLLTYRGDLACDCLRYSLRVYDAQAIARQLSSGQAVAQRPAPVAEASFATDSPYEQMAGIIQPRWDGNGAVLFTAVRDHLRQVFRLSLVSGAVSQLTSVADALESSDGGPVGGVYNAAAAGDALVFTTPAQVALPPLSATYPSLSVADQPISGYDQRSAGLDRVYVGSSHGGDARRVAACVGGVSGQLALSPNGRSVVFGCRRLANWSDAGNISEAALDQAEPRAFLLADTRGGNLRRLAAAAPGNDRGLVWSDDGTRIALVGLAAPQTGCAGPSVRQILVFDPTRNRLSCVATVDAAAGESHARVSGMRWQGNDGLVIVFTAGQPLRRFERSFALRGGRWRSTPNVVAAPAGRRQAVSPVPGLDVVMREDLNIPWSIVARLGEHEVALTAPDPVLDGVGRAPVRDVSWQEGNVMVHGGLILPIDRHPGARLPLVIQLGDYEPHQFQTDGSGSTMFAAQALAAQGMAVINVDVDPQPGQDYTVDARGSASHSRIEDLTRLRIDAVVDLLDRQGVIDRSRVGLVGFSYTGFQVHYLASHPGRTRLAAAIVADSWTGGYGLANYYAGVFKSRDSVDRINQYWGGNFWENRDAWLANSPLFNAGKVTAPILFTQHRGLGIPHAVSETLSAYRQLNKPFEFLLFPQGEHQLRLPRQRTASMGANVAWMAFWLQDREIAGLQSEETYARWRQLRARSAAPAATSVGGAGPS